LPGVGGKANLMTVFTQHLPWDGNFGRIYIYGASGDEYGHEMRTAFSLILAGWAIFGKRVHRYRLPLRIG